MKNAFILSLEFLEIEILCSEEIELIKQMLEKHSRQNQQTEELIQYVKNKVDTL